MAITLHANKKNEKIGQQNAMQCNGTVIINSSEKAFREPITIIVIKPSLTFLHVFVLLTPSRFSDIELHEALGLLSKYSPTW